MCSCISYDMFYNSKSFGGLNPWPLFMGRHHGGRGFGHFASGFMGGHGHGGPGFRTGRKLAAADLQLLILALLAEKPSHGYELIKELEERSGGFYSPSPGMIYPALTYIEEIGHATVEAVGTKKLYRITDEGRRYLDQNRTVVDAMLSELERIGGKMERIRRVFGGQESAGAEEEDAFDSRGSDELRAARRTLKMALHQKHHCSVEEARRIAEILTRAAADILGK
jgi:DNA-binding PadR family transcriptional regulator